MSEPTLSERFVVETPENIRFGYDVADIGSRFLAISIDTLIQGILYVIFFFTAAVLASQLTRVELPREVNDGLAIVVIIALFLIQFGYFLFFEIIMNGQTPGKRLFGLRVIKDNSYPLSPLDAVIRNLVRIIDFFPLAYGVGVITMFTNTRAKRLGDFAASTIVVKMHHQVRLQDLQVTAPPASPQTNVALHLSPLDEQDVALAESFLRRQATLVNRDTLALQMAQRLAAKMQLPASATPKTVAEAFTFLRETTAAYRRPRA